MANIKPFSYTIYASVSNLSSKILTILANICLFRKRMAKPSGGPSSAEYAKTGLLRRIFEETSERIETILTNTPSIRMKNPALAARLVVQTIEALTHWYVLYAHDEIDSDEFIDEAFAILRGYLSSNDRNQYSNP